MLLACHKQVLYYSNDFYIPIHVGKKINPHNIGYRSIADNTGVNISSLNPLYCKLTAQYWGWKNLDCEYIGLQHYRRYFNYDFTNTNIEESFKDCDIIVARPLCMSCSIFEFWCNALVPEDVYVALKLLMPKNDSAVVDGADSTIKILFLGNSIALHPMVEDFLPCKQV